MENEQTITIKQEKGFTGVDLTISVIVIVLFVSIITTAFYNLYLSSAGVERNTQATAYLVDILETAGIMDYDLLTKETLTAELTNLNIANGYDVTVDEVIKYSQMDTTKKDLIKKVTVSVRYLIGERQEELSMSTLIVKK